MALITMSEELWEQIQAEAKMPKISRKVFINRLCALGFSRKAAKRVARDTNGHYGEVL